MTRAARLCFCLAIPLLACGPRWVEDTPSGSTVVYEPVARPRAEGVPPRLPAAPATVLEPHRPHPEVVEIRSGQSVVRYEPILDLAYDAEEDEPTDPHAPTSPAVSPAEHGGDAGGDDRPLEDRAPSTSMRPPARPSRPAHGPVDPAIFDVHLTEDGLALPYPTTHVFRGFGPCRGRRHHHEAIDLGGVGPDWGVGTPIRSMARAEVLFIGTGDANPEDFGTPDKRDGDAQRGDRMLPRWQDIEPYGRVYFFTKKKGRWRSGSLIVTRALEGPLAGHVIRYLHIAAPHPGLAVGGIVERGQEIALMGGTGVQESAPHLHLDIQAPDGRRLDVAPLLGLAPTASCGERDDDRQAERTPRVERTRLDDKPPSRTRDEGTPPARESADAPSATLREPETPQPTPEPEAAHLELRPLKLERCKTTARSEDFSSGRYRAHTAELLLLKGQKVTIEARRKGGEWKPRVAIDGGDIAIKTLATGKIGAKAVVSITARDDTALRVTIDGWKPELPRDAAYTLEVRETCRGRR